MSCSKLSFSVQQRCGHATSTVASYPGAQKGGAEEERKKSAWYLLHVHALNVRLFYCKISWLCFDNVVAVILDDALVITSSVSTCVAMDHSPCRLCGQNHVLKNMVSLFSTVVDRRDAGRGLRRM